MVRILSRSRLAALRFSVAATLALALGLFATGPTPARADALTTTTYNFDVTCVSIGQLCSPTYGIFFETGGVLQVQFTALPSLCSDISLTIRADAASTWLTEVLTPGASTPIMNIGPVTPGWHLLFMQATGYEGGCNSGTLASWGGTMSVTTSAPPPRLPTSTNQCKGAGWQSFGVFKNQGDCVSFVATGGENPPAN